MTRQSGPVRSVLPHPALRLGGGTVDPEAAALELVERGGQVGDAGHGQVFGGPGAGLVHHGGEARAAALGDDDAVRPGALRAADNRAQVVHVAYLVADYDEGRLPSLLREGEDVVYARVMRDRGDGDDALMGARDAYLVELAAVDRDDGDAPFRGPGR